MNKTTLSVTENSQKIKIRYANKLNEKKFAPTERAKGYHCFMLKSKSKIGFNTCRIEGFLSGRCKKTFI